VGVGKAGLGGGQQQVAGQGQLEAELLPAALALAADMVSALPEALRAYKRVLNEGECLPLGEALALEKRHSRDWARHQSAEALEQRRTAVQARGREQTQ